ncbi:RNA-directed DNA polymerase from mobile element jockey [Elysia marginata]|uniref:RNA-directed DNA polymerase from mobile element jockey n=1 Tax=Elysia marginata TaxID=1093978 RepID=A0AAV4HIT6_9GAST|nr:RNA-directed DNA polymerase from mobile element jockey [Elysia marginata]
MERTVNTRMTWYLEKNNILVEEQAGFRRDRCTEDQIILIAQDIEDGFQEKRHTVVVWIDMAKAFDRVWRDDHTSQGCLWRNVRRRYGHIGNRGIHWNRTGGAPTTGTRGPKNVDRKMADENKP